MEQQRRNGKTCEKPVSNSTLSVVSVSAPCSFSQSVSCLSGSWSAGMWQMEGGEMSKKMELEKDPIPLTPASDLLNKVEKKNPIRRTFNHLLTWRPVSDFDQLQVLCPLLQRGLQDLLVLLLLLQQLLQQPAEGTTTTTVTSCCSECGGQVSAPLSSGSCCFTLFLSH